MATPRPKDRKAQIARESAEAFSALGYHGVTMEQIATRVGVSATALYRHYSSKYELFRDAVLNLGQQLVDATAFADIAAPDLDAHALLTQLVGALTDSALDNRASGGLYRWEGRFLRPEDQQVLDGQLRTVHHRIQRPLEMLHPGLSSRARWTSSTAILSVVGSIVDHRARLSTATIRALLAEVATVIAAAELAPPTDAGPPAAGEPVAPRTKYQALLDESMRLFNDNGYRDTSVEDIGAAVGLPASGVYRYFDRKCDLLAASFLRAAGWLSDELAAIAAAAPDPEAALVGVIDCYVRRSFEHPELAYVYYTERLNLSPQDQRRVHGAQLAAVEYWVGLVTAVRPDWTAGEARFAVHAAAALVVDIGRLTGYRNSPETLALVSGLLDLTLLGRYRLRIALPAR